MASLFEQYKQKLDQAIGGISNYVTGGQAGFLSGGLAKDIVNAGNRVENIVPKAAGFAAQQVAAPITQYAKNQVVNEIGQGINQIQQPGLLNKGLGAMRVAGGAFNATPTGVISNVITGAATGVGKQARGSGNLIDAYKAMLEPTSFAREGLGVNSPLVALGIDVLSSGGDPRAVKGLLKDGASVIKGGKSLIQNFSMDPGEYQAIVRAEEILQDPAKYLENLVKNSDVNAYRFKTPDAMEKAVNSLERSALETLDEIGKRRLPDKEMKILSGDPKKLIKRLVDLHSNNKLVERPGAIPVNKPYWMGLAEDTQAAKGGVPEGGVTPAEIKRVADNIEKNNPGFGRANAEAMASDVIKNRKFNSPQPEGGVTKLAQEAKARGYNDKNPLANIYDVKQELNDEIMKAQDTMSQIGNKYVQQKIATKNTTQSPLELMSQADKKAYKEAEKVFDKNIELLKSEYPSPQPDGGVTTQAAKEVAKGQLSLDTPSNPLTVQKPVPATKTNLLESPLEQTAIQTQSLKAAGKIPEETKSFEDIVRSSPIDVKSKVNILDYFRTPDRVLKKIGLGQEADLLRQKYDDYLAELPKEINKITSWSKEVPPESSQRIFKYLDGQAIELAPQELKVANDVKGYLKTWADRLKLPEDKRITNYITHIFDKDFIQKEFDPDLARLIENRIAGSVYDPFVEQRLGKLGYVEDTWKALDAYVKRAVRKVHMDEALNQLKGKADSLEQSQFRYVKEYIDRVNMRPTEWDNLLDNFIKSTPVGYKLGLRPTAAVTRGIRQAIYRGTLGLNVGSAVRNLTQGANTYAKLGEKYTIVGYMRAIKDMVSKSGELEHVGILRDELIQDRTLSATKKFWENLDKGLFSFFEAAERINRGSAYFGAKAKAIAEGMNEAQAIEYAKNIVRDTQFTFGRVDTPVGLQSDLVKFATQFQSYNVKQTEFLADMVRNKEFAGVIRWALASLGMVYTVGQAIGMEPKDLIPSLRIGGSPFFTLAKDALGAATGSKDQYGNELSIGDQARKLGNDLIPFVPGGVQIKKTITGLKDVSRGYSESESGRIKYPVSQDTGNYLKGGLLGPYNLPEAQTYRKEQRTPLGDKQSAEFRSATDPQAYYKQVMDTRQQNRAYEEAKKSVEDAAARGEITLEEANAQIKRIKEMTKPATPATPKFKKVKAIKAKTIKVSSGKSSKAAKINMPKIKTIKLKSNKVRLVKSLKPKKTSIPKVKKIKLKKPTKTKIKKISV